MPADEEELELRTLEPGDKFAGFSLGDAAFTPLKTFLKKKAKSFSEQMLAKTYVWAAEDRIAAYVTLVCGEIASETTMANLGADYDYDHYPAVKIARLAVSTRYQGRGLGRRLVEFSLGRTQDIARIAGCRFVVLDAKRESIEFYANLGFRMLDTAENRGRDQPLMFLDLRTLN